jgi:hypothetical protein
MPETTALKDRLSQRRKTSELQFHTAEVFHHNRHRHYQTNLLPTSFQISVTPKHETLMNLLSIRCPNLLQRDLINGNIASC